MLEVTERARDILLRARDAARRMNPAVVIRVVQGGAPLLAEGPEPDDLEVADGVWAAAGLSGTLDGGEHDRLELR